MKTGIHFANFGLVPGMVFEGTTECMNVFIVSVHFAHFGLASGMMVFEGTTECMNVFIVSVLNEKERKRNMRIRNGFEQLFVCALTAT